MNDTQNDRNVQSKLRNGKGKRTTGFTVPASPAKSENGLTVGKRKTRPSDLELSPVSTDSNKSTAKRSRSQVRNTPTPNMSSEPGTPQPTSPVLIECPEPNCSKKYKHINGLKYHQTHAHNESSKFDIDQLDNEQVKNSSDVEDNNMDGSLSPSYLQKMTKPIKGHEKTNEPENCVSDVVDVNSVVKGALMSLDDSDNLKSDEPILPSTSEETSPANSATNSVSSVSSSSHVDKLKSFTENSVVNKSIGVSLSLGGKPTLPTNALTGAVKLTQSKPVVNNDKPANSSLEILKKDKPKNKKKKEEEEREKEKQNTTNDNVIELDLPEVIEESQTLCRSPLTSISSTAKDLRNISQEQTNVSDNAKPVSESSVDFTEPIENSAIVSTVEQNVQSPAYSDISDANDATNENDAETELDKNDEALSEKQVGDLSLQGASSTFGVYPYFNQSPYFVVGTNSTPRASSSDSKSENEFSVNSRRSSSGIETEIVPDKTRSEDPASSNAKISDYPNLSQPSYPYPFGYMQGYSYSIETAYHMHYLSGDSHFKHAEERREQDNRYKSLGKPDKEIRFLSEKRSSPPVGNLDFPITKPASDINSSSLNILQNMNASLKEKQNENHQILKENIELKSQMDAHSLKAKKPLPANSSFGMFDSIKEESSKKSILDKDKTYPIHDRVMGPTRKEDSYQGRFGDKPENKTSSKPSFLTGNPSPKSSDSSINAFSFHKDASKKDKTDDKEDKRDKFKEEGVKPTMETTGPPPPPINGYFFNTPFMHSHFSHMPPFDAGHPMLRSSSINPPVMGHPFGAPSPYVHPQLRYHLTPSSSMDV